MSTTITEPAADVVVVGLGATGGIICAELVKAGLKVVGIDKGPYLDYSVDFAESQKFDEWKTQFAHFYDHHLSMWTYSIRNEPTQFAIPVRRYTKSISTVPEAHEVGGMCVHFSGGLGRYMPWTYQAYSMTNSRYGTSFLDSIEGNIDLEDYPFTAADLVPYAQSWEQCDGVSGTNQEPFIPNSTYPVPPHPTTALGTLFNDTASDLGYHPYPSPTGILSEPYVNQYGLSRNECVYDGWCTTATCNFVCETGAKGSSHVSAIPYALASSNFTMVTNSYVFRVNLNSAQTQATGVSYYDQAGNIHIQPASVVHISQWSGSSMRQMFLSGIGTQYNYTTQTGALGRGFVPTPVGNASTSGTIAIGGNGYPAGNASGGGYAFEDWAGDNVDHTGLNFIGGVTVSAGGYPGGSINTLTLVSPGATNFGSTYKANLKNHFLPTTQTVSVGGSGIILPTYDHFTDLDPHYEDMYGDPILRMCMDNDTNAPTCTNYFAQLPEATTLLQKLGATNIKTSVPAISSIAHVDRWSAHQRGGARAGANPSTSAFNAWLQSWTVDNVFTTGEHLQMLGDNVTPGTHGIGPYAYLASEGIQMYLKSPGPLAT